MNSIAAILDSLIVYRYSLILALASAASICFFLACCSYGNIPFLRASAAVLTAILLSLPLSRLVYWYGRPDRYSSLYQALTTPGTESLALIGTFAGCILSAIMTGGAKHRNSMLDYMSIAGCAGIALGRLGSFFTATVRGQVMHKYTWLPWAYPVSNSMGHSEYRFATFLFQSAAAAVLGIFLAWVLLRKKPRSGDTTLLFFLFYSSTQIILDSTRYDALYLHSNGFVHIVQILAALTLVAVLLFLSIQAMKISGWQFRMIPLWIPLLALLSGVGFMEYFVQRHGRQAALGYTIMGILLSAIVCFGLILWHLTQSKQQTI